MNETSLISNPLSTIERVDSTQSTMNTQTAAYRSSATTGTGTEGRRGRQLVAMMVIQSELLSFVLRVTQYVTNNIVIRAITCAETGERSMRFSFLNKDIHSLASICTIREEAFENISLWNTFTVVIDASGLSKAISRINEFVGLSFYGILEDEDPENNEEDVDDYNGGGDGSESEENHQEGDDEENNLKDCANITHYKLHLFGKVQSVIKWLPEDLDSFNYKTPKSKIIICKTKIPKLLSVLRLIKVSDDTSSTVEDNRNEHVVEAIDSSSTAKILRERMPVVLRARREPPNDADDSQAAIEDNDNDEDSVPNTSFKNVRWKRITLEHSSFTKVNTRIVLYSSHSSSSSGSGDNNDNDNHHDRRDDNVLDDIHSEIDRDFNIYFSGTYLSDILSRIRSHVGDDDVYLNFGFRPQLTRTCFYLVVACKIKKKNFLDDDDGDGEMIEVGDFYFIFGPQCTEREMQLGYNDENEILSDGDDDDDDVDDDLTLMDLDDNGDNHSAGTGEIVDLGKNSSNGKSLMEYLRDRNKSLSSALKKTTSTSKKKPVRQRVTTTTTKSSKSSTSTRSKTDTEKGKGKKNTKQQSRSVQIDDDDIPDFFSDDEDDGNAVKDEKKKVKSESIAKKLGIIIKKDDNNNVPLESDDGAHEEYGTDDYPTEFLLHTHHDDDDDDKKKSSKKPSRHHQSDSSTVVVANNLIHIKKESTPKKTSSQKRPMEKSNRRSNKGKDVDDKVKVHNKRRKIN